MKKLQSRVVIFGLLLLTTLPLLAQSQRSFFVKPNIQGTGSSWVNATNDLSGILRNARAGDVIWVAMGTYTPSQTGDRTASFIIPEGVRLYGGFVGYETQLNARDLVKNPTILSGNIGHPDSLHDNSYSVVRFHAVSRATVLDGFLIRDGRAGGGSEELSPSACGGGIYLEAASPTIRNCTLTNNYAAYGGGLYINARQSKSAPNLKNCSFRNNQAELYGGGIRTKGGLQDGALVLESCQFVRNRALYGAAIANQLRQGNYVVQLQSCGFRENFADLRGGAILNQPSGGGNGKIRFEACSFTGNTSTIGREADEKPYKNGSGVLLF